VLLLAELLLVELALEPEPLLAAKEPVH